jgi:hypothetical protein
MFHEINAVATLGIRANFIGAEWQGQSLALARRARDG